ncbi:MAG TPA: hypothetical protein PLI07_09065 [Candidatus Hydrogenedentes bacterium]|nr:hypothetical protein [Candidatus Hydrogenedentota bacterium]
MGRPLGGKQQYPARRSQQPGAEGRLDTGNPPTYRQNSWDYYQAVYKDIVYVHIKDARIVEDKEVYTYCGEGDGYVKEIVRDLLAKGYDGGFSIEPHLAAVIHTGQKADTEQHLYESYVEYGRRLMKIVEDTRKR